MERERRTWEVVDGGSEKEKGEKEQRERERETRREYYY